jgi:coatomer subunit beta
MSVIELVRLEARGEGGNKVRWGRQTRSHEPHASLTALRRPNDQAKWIRCIFELLNATSHAVKYEAALSLTTLTQNPAAVKGERSVSEPGEHRGVDHANLAAAAGAFVDLIVKESDNNVKLIVLDRFDVLRAKHEHVLDSFVLDILKVLNRYVYS